MPESIQTGQTERNIHIPDEPDFTCPEWCIVEGPEHGFYVNDEVEDPDRELCVHRGQEDPDSFMWLEQWHWHKNGRTWRDAVLGDGEVNFEQETPESLREYAAAVAAFADKLEAVRRG